MTIVQASTNESLRETLNRAPVGSLADQLRAIGFGDVLRSLPVHLAGVSAGVTGAVPQQLSTLGCVQLPEDAKAASILRCSVRAAGVTLGEFTPQAYGATPATTQVAVAPNGDIVFLGSDAVTQADIIYVPMKGDVLGNQANSKYGVTSLTLAVNASGFAAFPTSLSGKVKLLLQANVTAGTVTGQKIILVPTTAVVAAGRAALANAGTGVWLNLATDAPTQVVVDVLTYTGLGSPAGNDVNALLEGLSSDT